MSISADSEKRSENSDKNRKFPIIASSDHLVPDKGWQLSELEYGMIMSYHAFSRWMTSCMAVVGYRDLNPLDIMVLHNVNHRARDKRLTDITFMLNIDDMHIVSYSLKKLGKLDLVKSEKRGKEVFYFTSETGKGACIEYRKIRDICLIAPAITTDHNFDETEKSATLLRGVSGLYDQASRTASSL